MADMSAEDLQPTLDEGGEAAMEALVEKAKTAPGSVFEAETLRALAQLAKANFPALGQPAGAAEKRGPRRAALRSRQACAAERRRRE